MPDPVPALRTTPSTLVDHTGRPGATRPSPRLTRLQALALTTLLAAAAGPLSQAQAQTPAQAQIQAQPQTQTQPSPSAAATSAALRPVTVASGLQNPWGMAFLPDFERSGRVLVTERGGSLRLVGPDGQVGPPIEGVPAVDSRGQGGLLDVVLDPAFSSNQRIYLSYAEPGSGPDAGKNSTAVYRARLDGPRLVDGQVIFRQSPKVASSAHFGSRLVFGRDGHLFITLGDRYSRRNDAQTLDNHHGKVVRINTNGQAPADNPLLAKPQPGALPEIWSWGHRNLQGAALHPQTGALWTHEHGPQGGDELNLTAAGQNFGWPVITYGAEYGSGAAIGEGTAKAGMQQPLTRWVPSIAPSGLAFVTSERYPGWQGSLVLGALRGQMLVRLTLDGNRVSGEERLLSDLGERIRDVRQGPDGWLYLLTDSRQGKLIRLQR